MLDIPLLGDGAHLSLSLLRNLLHQKFSYNGIPQDSTKRGKQTLEAMVALLELAESIKSFTNAFEATNRISYLDGAIALAERLAAVGCFSSTSISLSLLGLSGLLSRRYDRVGVVEDLQLATKWAEEAVAATPSDHPDRASRLSNLSNHLSSRFERLGELQDLNQAIDLGGEAVAATPSDHPDRATWLSNLSIYLSSRFEQLGELQDLNQAIDLGGEAVAATPSDHPDRASWLSNLSNHLSLRFERLGELQDLSQAIDLGGQAVATTPSGHPDRASWLSNLSNHLSLRFERLGELQDLNQAINLTGQAVAATPSDHPDRATWLSNLSNHLSSRFERLGELQDLNQAIDLGGQAVATTPSDHPDRASWLSNLSIYLSSRFEQLGELQDLNQAIDLGGQAVAATPSDHSGRATWLSNLSNHLSSRFKRLGELQDLNQAIDLGGQAVAATPSDHPDRASRLSNLSIYLSSRFERLGELQDLNQAIDLGGQAVAATPSDHPDRASRLSNLSTYLSSRFERLGELQDLNQAIGLGGQAVAATPSDHPDRAGILVGLARSLNSRPFTMSSTKNYDEILDLFCTAWHCTMSPPYYRIAAAHNAGLILASRHRWQESSSLLEEAVKILLQLSPRTSNRDEQAYNLSRGSFAQLTADAVSIALQAGAKASHSLRLLEHGRGIIAGLVIDCRSDLSELYARDPQTFEKFNQLRIEIDSPQIEEERGYDVSTEQQRRKREQAVRELEETLASIRQLPGLKDFLLPPPSEDLKAMAEQGPIVIVNSTIIRSDAIIVTTSTIKALALPRLLIKDVSTRMKQIPQLVRGSPSTYLSRNRKMEGFLLWLWNAVVEPVLVELQFDSINDENNSTRVWWIGVGPLAMAPFHAAGDHSDGSTRNTISRAISSYIPTIKALSYTREKRLELLSKPDSHLILVTMPTTPGQKPLQNASLEADQIAGAVKGRTITTRLDHPSSDKVLKHLPSCHAIHFACHGVSNGANPSSSHLLLRKDDGTIDELPVRAISQINIKNAQIAYLSACCTADNPSESLADESIHIASGFQLAGFSHVLATLWESDDRASRQVAEDFYKFLFREQGVGDGDHRKVSASFHKAVKGLRDQNRRQPLLWASFIHTGA